MANYPNKLGIQSFAKDLLRLRTALNIQAFLTPQHYCMLTISTAKNLTNDAWVTIDFDVTTDDTGGMADLTNNEIIIPISGLWSVGFHIAISVGAAGRRQAQILLDDDTTAIMNTSYAPVSSGLGIHTAWSGMTMVMLDANETIKLKARQSSGTTLTATTTITNLWARYEGKGNL